MVSLFSGFYTKWLREAPVGDRLIYHTGFLAQDRYNMRLGDDGRIYFDPNSIDTTAQLAWQSYERGNVHLVQQKLSEGVYAYIAIRR